MSFSVTHIKVINCKKHLELIAVSVLGVTRQGRTMPGPEPSCAKLNAQQLHVRHVHVPFNLPWARVDGLGMCIF